MDDNPDQITILTIEDGKFVIFNHFVDIDIETPIPEVYDAVHGYAAHMGITIND